MIRFYFIPLAGVPLLLLLRGAYGEFDPKVSPADCLRAMNAARDAVGLANFASVPKDKSQLLIPADENKSGKHEATEKKTKFWDAVCQGYLPQDESIKTIAIPEGTYAYFPLSKPTPDCAAAVDYWKSGISSFGTDLPPVYNKPQVQATPNKPYDVTKAVSFVALYTSKPNPAAECAVVTCTPKGPSIKSLAAEKAAYALFCVTTPPALTDKKAPYQESEWKKITNVLGNSASVAAPNIVALLTAAAAGLALL